jgi:hypothetical protein
MGHQADRGAGIFMAVVGLGLLIATGRETIRLRRQRSDPMPVYPSRYGRPMTAAEKLRQIRYAVAVSLTMLLFGFVMALTTGW